LFLRGRDIFITGSPRVKNTEYLSDGITESIISNLSRLPQLKVMARSTVFHFKGKEIDPRDVGRQLGVRAVMSGRLLQQGDHLIVRAELVNVADGAQLWGAEYDRKLSDVLALQQEISREISENLRLKLTGEDKKRLAGRDTNNAEAYQLYLLGRFHWSKFTEGGLRKSIDYFNQALAKDPNYALAYHGLSDAYQVIGQTASRPNDVLPKALVYADKALAADPTLPEAHLSRGACELWYGWNWTMAEQELKRAMELNTNLADPHDLYGQFLSGMGRFDEAIAESKRSLELDPLSPLRSSNLAGVYYWARQYDLAIGQSRKVMELDPNFFLGPVIIAQAYGQQGKYPEAIAQLIKTRDLAGGFAPATSELGYIYAVSGQRTKAQELLGELQERAEREFIDPYYIAIIYVGLGREDETLAWLNKAYDERSFWLLWLRVEPKFDRLRSDSRYQDLVHRMNFPS
jgi:TolB-like protein/Tfp pilus assembly protein PilF